MVLLKGGNWPTLFCTALLVLFTFISAFSPPFVSARDLKVCPLGYSSCSGIKDYSPVCCPTGCACQRSQDGFAFCLMPGQSRRGEQGGNSEIPCCVEGSYCVRLNNGWPICPEEGFATSARIVDAPRQGSAGNDSPSRPSPRLGTVRRPSTFDAAQEGDDDNLYDMSNDLVPTRVHPYSPYQPRPPRPSATSKLSELRLSPDWDIYAPPQTREFFWEIAEHPGSPDGFHRPMLLINGQFPGPLMEVNNGDLVRVHVTNLLDEPTTIHFHGIIQNGTNWADGPSGVTQCPILPGGTYTYEFPITGDLQYGTYWHHSHRRATYIDGISGPIIVHSPNDPLVRGRDFDIDQIIFLKDWYHDTSDDIVDALLSPGGYNQSFLAPSPQTGLINGAAIYDCSLSPRQGRCDQKSQLDLPELVFPPNKRVRLRFIYAGAHPEMFVSVDNHVLRVIEADDSPVWPLPVHRIPINLAQRYSAILDTSSDAVGDSFYLRAHINTDCLDAPFPDLTTQNRLVIRIGEEGQNLGTALPRTRDWNDRTIGPCTDLDERLLEPRVAESVPEDADMIRYFNSSRIGPLNTTDQAGLAQGVDELLWTVNNITFENFAFDPLLHQIVRGEDPDTGRIALLETQGIGSLDIVIQNVVGPPHPFHLHGRPFAILARGEGLITPSEVASLDVNTRNSLRRDTLSLLRNSWVIVRVVTDTPGIWLFHCHILWHQSQGLVGALLVQPHVVRNFHIPQENHDLCRRGDPNLIDPGRKKRSKLPTEPESHTGPPPPYKLPAIHRRRARVGLL
ncbi:hypothetical protein JCM10908_002035 [Rhodotorula pacifica]|uniref:uncharacterized protein n=1 Tax=Rhodotorula pacifica TaxID=1495444 RepID=UPI003175ABE7